MALWMEKGSQPQTDSEIADLDAINALKQSSAIELREKGNEYVKQGKKHYSDAVNCYTRAIDQNALSDPDNSILYSNRAHVNLLLGNYRRALTDAQEAIRLSPTNVKAYYRAAKASFALNLLSEAKSYCEAGIQKDPDNVNLMKLENEIDSTILEDQRREREVSNAMNSAKDLVSAIEDRKLKIGKAVYQELTGLKKPTLDRNNILHWPVLLLYAEVMSSDFIEDFCEIDMFSAHLDMMFSESSPPLPWDEQNNYTRDVIELYYEADSGTCLSKGSLLKYYLEGTAGSRADLGNVDAEDSLNTPVSSGKALLIRYSANANSLAPPQIQELRKRNGSKKWEKVDEKRVLNQVLRDPRYIIPGIPVFFVVSRKSDFFKVFKSGRWSPH